MTTGNRGCLVLFNFLVLVLCCEANIGVIDEVWLKRAEEAKEAARQAYQSNPQTVLDDLNGEVHRATEGSNSTRRDLGKDFGSCTATNPIDQCWRCKSNWEKNRMGLTDCAMGFGRRATGGKGGKIYVVTDPSDDYLIDPKPGTLRHAVTRSGPLWIIFRNSMIIKLKQELIMTSHKTIDGRGAQVLITNVGGITLQFIRNVIIHNVRIHNIRTGGGGLIRDSVNHFGFRSGSDGDGISLFGATDIWIDHVSMSNCQDGLIDIIQASTAVTISNCHFTHHNDVMLFGASDTSKEDAVMQVTVAFNHFGQGLVQRMPRVRWGFAHVVNNDYTHWLLYAIGGSMHPTILSQGNRFIAPFDPYSKEVTKRDYAPESEWKNWEWRSEGDFMMNGAFFRQSGNLKHVFAAGVDLIKPKPGSFAGLLTRYAGALKCIPGRPC